MGGSKGIKASEEKRGSEGYRVVTGGVKSEPNSSRNPSPKKKKKKEHFFSRIFFFGNSHKYSEKKKG
jgi:hypothetical protein